MPIELKRFLIRKYGADSSRVAEIERFWRMFKPFADPGFLETFCTENEEEFQQRYWELWLGAWLLRQGIQLLPNMGEGPDFNFKFGGQHVWIEAVSPGPGKGANQVPEPVYQELGQPLVGHDVPAREMLLRHTAAVREKIIKYRAHVTKGIVQPQDAFIIAIDSSQVCLSSYYGKSGFPVLIEAVYPVGPKEVHFPLDRRGKVKTTIQHRPAISNINQAKIPTDVFLHPDNVGISGIIGASESASMRVLPSRPTIFVHNKLARVPVRPLPFQVEEYFLEDAQSGYKIQRINNRPPQG